MMRWFVVLALMLSVGVSGLAQDFPTADIMNDEGGVVSVVGEYFPTIPRLRDFGSQPVVFLGDISDVFVEGGFEFSLENLTLESSQMMAYTEGDIRFEPLRYQIQLPIEPDGVLTDLSGDDNVGIMLYSVNFTFNGIGSPFIDDREFITFSSITYSKDYETLFEINGGRVLIYAPEDGQAFPVAYGADGLLFTDDDPLVTVPAGYTMVDMRNEPFTFDRSHTVTMDILESEGEEFQDFSDMTYSEAFDAMAEMMRKEYAFTEFKGVDWDALVAQYRPLMVQAEANRDRVGYMRAVDDFLKSIPDGHVGSNAIDGFFNDVIGDVGGGIGISLVEAEDGRYLVSYLLEGGPAEQAGIEVGAEVYTLNDMTIPKLMVQQNLWFGPYSSDHQRRIEQLRLVTRFGNGEQVTVAYANPNGAPQTISLQAVGEVDTFYNGPFDVQTSGLELPVEYDILDSGYGYVAIYTFSDDNLLSFLLWERAMRLFIEADVPGIVIDMRSNGGGSPDISNVMLGYLFDTLTYTGTSAYYFPDIDEFAFDPLYNQSIEPTNYYYDGDVAVLISPMCYSACEFFTYALTLRDNVDVVGYYPTSGLGGGIKQFAMPEGINAQFTVGRAVGADNTIHIEGTGVPPTVVVPRTVENLTGDGDAVLETAIEVLGG